ncbi:MAG: lipopolysaccharide transport system permease protein [Acidobacteriota bacterium]|jgi:lipopolysaccharide transport system permease protein|nr:lipopolysaccharide transport system permease protein [Acidobacteriota bacterium]
MAVKDIPVTVIERSRGWVAVRLDELWEHRELLYFFVWRDVKVRYKQTALGAAWAVLQPLLTMLIFTIFFGRMAGIGSEGVPYPIFSYAGLLPWTFFSAGLGQASNSLVGSAGLLKKVYFPRLIVPVSAVLGGLVDFAVAFVVLIGMMFWYGVQPSWGVLLLPLLLLLSAASALGAGLFLSAVNVEFRDVRYVMPFFIQLLLFVTPVIYPASKVTAKLEEIGLPGWLYGLNPMAGVIQGFRWSLLGSGMNPGPLLAAGTAVTGLLLVGGLFYFRRMERTFADVV